MGRRWPGSPVTHLRNPNRESMRSKGPGMELSRPQRCLHRIGACQTIAASFRPSISSSRAIPNRAHATELECLEAMMCMLQLTRQAPS
jgi:hypothetical protein